MKSKYFALLKKYYEERNTRERILIIFLTAALIYALFYLFIFRGIETQETIINAEITAAKNQIINWNKQIELLKKLASTPEYKQWASHQQTLKTLRAKYKTFLNVEPNKQWQKCHHDDFANEVKH